MKDTKHIKPGMFILLPGACPRGGTLGLWGAQGVIQLFFFKHSHVAYQIDGDDEQNRMQVNIYPMAKLVTLG